MRLLSSSLASGSAPGYLARRDGEQLAELESVSRPGAPNLLVVLLTDEDGEHSAAVVELGELVDVSLRARLTGESGGKSVTLAGSVLHDDDVVVFASAPGAEIKSASYSIESALAEAGGPGASSVVRAAARRDVPADPDGPLAARLTLADLTDGPWQITAHLTTASGRRIVITAPVTVEHRPPDAAPRSPTLPGTL